MDETIGTSMLDGTDFLARLDAIEERLDRHARGSVPSGLTEPDPGATERWEAAQVWAHMAEFVGYWHAELAKVVADYDGSPVPFGRTKTDPGRIAAIEVGRSAPIPALRQRVHDALVELRGFLGGLNSSDWNAIGRHPTIGEMDLEAIVERFIVAHLDEHAEQLDGLG